MSWLAIGLVAVLVLAVVLTARRREAARRERAARLRADLDRALARARDEVDGSVLAPASIAVEPSGRGALRIVGGEPASALELPYDRLEDADLAGVAAGSLYLLCQGAAAHQDALVLRRQGTDITPHLVRASWLDAFPGADRVPATPLGNSGLAAVYRLASQPGLRYLSAASLEETGVSTADLHDAVEAMLSQRFDEAAVRRTVEQGETLLLEDEDGHSGAFLFLVPRLLGPDEELLAAVPGSGRLALAPGDGAAELAPLLASQPGEAPPLAPRLLRVTRDRITVAASRGDGPS